MPNEHGAPGNPPEADPAANEAEQVGEAAPPVEPQNLADAPDANLHVFDLVKPRHPGGRPSSYRVEFCEIAAQMMAAGATDSELCEHLEIHHSTMYRWIAQFAEFRAAVKLGKLAADERVERSLYHRAVGYSRPTFKIMQYEGVPVIVQHVEHLPPDPAAAIHWLKNRKPEDWRDRREITGKDGEPLAIKSVIEFVEAVATATQDDAGD